MILFLALLFGKCELHWHLFCDSGHTLARCLICPFNFFFFIYFCPISNISRANFPAPQKHFAKGSFECVYKCVIYVSCDFHSSFEVPQLYYVAHVFLTVQSLLQKSARNLLRTCLVKGTFREFEKTPIFQLMWLIRGANWMVFCSVHTTHCACNHGRND